MPSTTIGRLRSGISSVHWNSIRAMLAATSRSPWGWSRVPGSMPPSRTSVRRGPWIPFLTRLATISRRPWNAPAVTMNRSAPRGHLQFGLGLVTRARFDTGITHSRAAGALDPLSYAIGNDLATALECAGRYDESIASARQTLRNEPKYR